MVDLETEGASSLTPGPKAAYRDAAFFDATGKRVYVTSDREGEFTELYEV